MPEQWPTEFVDLFGDRFLKLSTLTLMGSPKELREKLKELLAEYEESLGRLKEAYRKKWWKRILWLVLAIFTPLLGIYLMGSGAVTGLWLLFLLFWMIFLPYYVFRHYLPKFSRLYEFYRRYEGASERIHLLEVCLKEWESFLEEKSLLIQLHLQGLEIHEKEFQEKLGTADTEQSFRGVWCQMSLPFRDHTKLDLEISKEVKVRQKLIQREEEEVFHLRRTFCLDEVVEVEATLDEAHYDGFRQLQTRDWQEGEHKLEICRIDASRYSLRLQARATLIEHAKGNRLYILLGEANAVHLAVEEILDLVSFLREHYLKKR